MLYYLFSAHHWPLGELQALRRAETGWHDLILALSSFEAEQRAGAQGRAPVGRLHVTRRR